LLADRRYQMALQLAEGGDFTAAADLLYQAIEIAPEWAPLYFHLGDALRLSGKKEKAVEALREYLALDPDDKMGATIKLTLLGAIDAPKNMPEAYVRSLFDQYAPKFEKCLVENLSYHTPEIIAEKIRAVHPEFFENLLDLGCGTGLGALQFKGSAPRMVGVDIAPAMVEHAKAKNIYAELHAASIESYLAGTDEKFALVLAADVFVYIGVLEELFKNVAAHMKDGGIFAFSTQKIGGGHKDWILGDDHRYAHSKNYIERCAAGAGLKILSCDDVDLRLDAGAFITGSVFVFEKENI